MKLSAAAGIGTILSLSLAASVTEAQSGACDMPAAHVFKVGADGLVHEIEAVGFIAPYNSATGWE